MGTGLGDLPSFAFPVVAWAPEPATGDPYDDGTREFLTQRRLTTIAFPETDLRHGWTFVDAEGRSWQVLSSRVTGRADPWWTRALPKWIHHPKYKLAYEFAERPPVSFDVVKSRLFAAVSANPDAYRDYYGSNRRRELRRANSLADLIKSEEALAIERLQPTPLGWQWVFWEGRASRLGFVAAFAVVAAAWPFVIMISPTTPAVVTAVIVSGFLGMSATVRRLHDLRLSGWWVVPWWAWSLLCASIYDVARDTGGQAAAFWLGWIAALCIFGCLALWPGTRGANRFGFAPSGRSDPAPRLPLT